jgi:hypothetical protein
MEKNSNTSSQIATNTTIAIHDLKTLWIANPNKFNGIAYDMFSPTFICLVLLVNGFSYLPIYFLHMAFLSFWHKIWGWDLRMLVEVPNIKWLPSFDGKCLQQRPTLHKNLQKRGSGKSGFLLWWSRGNFVTLRNVLWITSIYGAYYFH